MIISLRGTSGSGKSTIVREVVASYSRHRPWYEQGRRKPLYVVHGRSPTGRVLVVPGHYDIPNGGVDTLKSLDEAYRIARWANSQDFDVLMEGKNMSDGVAQVEQLQSEKRDVRVVHIDVPIERCVQSVRERGHRISEASIKKTDAKVRRDMEKFTCATYSGDRKQCLVKVREWLGLDISRF